MHVNVNGANKLYCSNYVMNRDTFAFQLGSLEIASIFHRCDYTKKKLPLCMKINEKCVYVCFLFHFKMNHSPLLDSHINIAFFDANRSQSRFWFPGLPKCVNLSSCCFVLSKYFFVALFNRCKNKFENMAAECL